MLTDQKSVVIGWELNKQLDVYNGRDTPVDNIELKVMCNML